MSPFTRREFLQTTATGAVLTIGVSLAGCATEAPPDTGGAPFAPDAWIRIDESGEVLVIVDRSEMGQGVSTSLPMIVAEELDADWSRVRYEFAPANEAYYNSLNGAQITGGSTSVMAAWVPLREAAAKARMMLLSAAADEWDVPLDRCRTVAGEVLHEESGRRLDYGDLVAKAATLSPPDRVALKDPASYRLIGRPVPRLDLERQVTGRIKYGLDAGPEGTLVAVVARCPVFGGTVRSYDAMAARVVPGVRHVVEIPEGVAVVADTTWQALQGRRALEVEWDEGKLATLDSAEIESRLHALGEEEGREARREGEGVEALAGAATVIEAAYDLPFLAHATMEPMCCTASVTDDGVTVWVPTQAQAAPALYGGGSRGVAADVAGVSQDRVTIHTTNLGGGFGRRAETDYVREAVGIAKVVRAPVRVVWTREDDIQHDFYRPASHHVLRAGVSEDDEILGWSHHVVAPSILQRFVPSFVPDWVTRLGGPLKGGIDPTAVEGAAEIPYAIPNIEVRYTRADLGIPVGFWRSVGHTHNAFVVETFIDELATTLGKDPVAFRLALLQEAPRWARVLEHAVERSDWGTPLPAGWGRGVAVHESFGSFAAQIAEVEVLEAEVRVRRVVCAFDCGIVINPDTVEAQLQSAIVFGLTAALKGEITISGGRVQQSNFHDYAILRIDEMPVIEVHLVPNGDAPGGVGEPGTPPIAPAVANAFYAATGRRIRRLPIRL